MQDLRDRVAVVTGAASGIGRALAERFVSEGMRVVLADVDRDGLDRVAASFDPDRVLAVLTDVGRGEEVERLRDATLARFGAVHVVCNNAGITRHTGQPIWDVAEQDWRRLIDVNLWGVIHGIRAFVPVLIAQSEPSHVINTASMAGLVVGGGAYGAAKHAVVALSESLHCDLAARKANVRVTCLCPGLVATAIADPRDEDVARETTEQSGYRERIRQVTREHGRSPAEIAALVVDTLHAPKFYVWTEDPPFIFSASERLQARVDHMLAGDDPVAMMRRPAPPSR